jgi:putative nucleotidyltransferase with HDIG domain
VPFLKIQALLNTDAALAADVLRLANSPLISARAEIKSVLQAVVLLGLDRIKALVTTLALRGFVTNAARKDTLHRCWRHSLATAVICERLARFFPVCKETCYTAGLLHDIGRLALLTAGSGQYERALSIEHPAGFDLLEYERSTFEIDHCEAGLWILEQWEFPPELRGVVALHHTAPGPGSSDLLRIVYAGWQTATLLGYSVKGEAVPGGVDLVMEILPEKERRHIIEGFDHLAGEVACALNAVECFVA